MVMTDVLPSLIAAVITGGALTQLLVWLKERKKDGAATRLTDVQTLQAKLAYVESVAEYLRKHSEDLQADYDELEERHRRVRQRVTELEEELDRVKRSAAQTQIECERLSYKIQELIEGQDDDNTHRRTDQSR
jgi:predicted RNase H-like nuclease (RuvC/YqgF family)